MAVTYSPFLASGTPVLPPNQAMSPGQYLLSDNGRYRLALQGDGNLVLSDGAAIAWVADGSQVYSRTLYQKRMREPLQFVVSNNGFLYDPGRKRLWIAEATQSTDKSLWYNSCMVLQDDGNLVIYDQRDGRLGWARFGFVPGRFPKPKKPTIYQKTWKWDFDFLDIK